MIPARSRSTDAAAIAFAKIVVALAALHFGFSHVSDDDYARTVISERFAIAPSFDPSGTSWLPFPFWITGSSMMAFGRSLETARNVAILMSALSCGAVYLALRAAQVARAPAIAGTVIAMSLPWSAWLGATNVPEGFTPQLMVIGMVTANAPTLRARSLGGLALLAASLSRYEAWPICALFFLSGLSTPIASKRFAAHAMPILGPLAWMTWNLHTHGSATHFLTRVAAYRDAIGASEKDFWGALLIYPRALLAIGMEPIFLGSFGLVVVCMRRDLRQRWAPPLFACMTLFAFLIYGESRGGAPTHHPERAVLAAAWVLIALGVDAFFLVGAKATRALTVGSIAAIVVWLATLPPRYSNAPGTSADEDRSPQIARGLDLRTRDVKHFSVLPCAYEHFALIAAFGAPERVVIASVSPRDAATHRPTAVCPTIQEN
ncbi:MAG: hypothetical protein ABI421_12575 [Polyangiaceae bacterium]